MDDDAVERDDYATIGTYHQNLIGTSLGELKFVKQKEKKAKKCKTCGAEYFSKYFSKHCLSCRA